jgi:hypothetical protein
MKPYLSILSSLFVASYDFQGYGGGILTRLHTDPSQLNLDHFCLLGLGTNLTESISSSIYSILESHTYS